MTTRKVFAILLSVFGLSACSRNPSILLDTAGPHAEKTANLFWFFLSVETVVWVLVMGVLFYAIWKRRTRLLVAPTRPSPDTERRLTIAVATAVGLTALILTTFVFVSYMVDRQMLDFDRGEALEIEVTAHQWWWEIRYLNKEPSEVFTTANEIHVPVHQKVRLLLQSNDVIHSLWFPNLSGKRDIIPGRNQDLVVQADRAGEWQGRCAEYCGLQHAYMGITLLAESPEDFERWKKAQQQPAASPTSAEAKRGEQVFQSAACVMCHTIRTTASTGHSTNAPDLTHLKSRGMIGAGAALNTKGNLGGWIIDPHGLKPGVHMPTILQEPESFQALLTYLETLK